MDDNGIGPAAVAKRRGDVGDAHGVENQKKDSLPRIRR